MNIRQIAESALALMNSQGFDDAQVRVSVTAQDEVNIAHNEASLLRSSETHKLSLRGYLDGRKASVELTPEFNGKSDGAVRQAVETLFASVQVAPTDDANAVSSGQRADIVQGPQQGDLAVLTGKVKELLGFRLAECPAVIIEEGQCAHTLTRSHVLTSRGSELSSAVGHYSMTMVSVAKDSQKSSSINYTSGDTDDLDAQPAAEFFGLGDMFRDCVRQIHTRSLDAGFVGEVVLSPAAVADMVKWLQGQVTDLQLIADSSLYKQRVGEAIAAPQLSVRSRVDGPGVCAITSDAMLAQPLALIDQGTLTTLLPSLYGSRKTGLPHVPSVGSGWTIDAGESARADLIASVERGALVGRLSMGAPAASGDFAGLIKNSFLIEQGQVGQALAEVMISGNLASMLRDIIAISRERIDLGSSVLPWIRIGNLHFS